MASRVAIALACWCAWSQQVLSHQEWSVRRLRVQDETRLDWAFPLMKRSPAEAPADLAAGYRSTSQGYELHGPPEDGLGGRWPLVIFISPSNRPVGWQLCEATCRRHGVLLADLIDTGNGKPMAHRVRAVVDVLDDLRRRYDVDPDRTYLAGFSGGAHVACTVGLHLPEYVGGVAAVGHAPLPIDDEALVAGAKRRLSLAIVVGEREPAAAQAEDYAAPWWEGMGIRTQLTKVRRLGHTLPKPIVFEETFGWLEGDVEKRRNASRSLSPFNGPEVLSRTEWANAYLTAAQEELRTATGAEAIDAAVVRLEGAVKRWPDVAAAHAAQSIIDEYAALADKPWAEARQARRLRTTALHADGLEKLAHRAVRITAHERLAYAKNAVWHLSQLATAERNPESAVKLQHRIAALEKLIADSPPDAAAMPLSRVRFDMNGDVTLAEGIAYLRNSLARLGYTLEVDESALQAAGVDLEKRCQPRIKAAELDAIDRRFLHRAGVKLQRSGKTIRLVPLDSSTTARPAAADERNRSESLNGGVQQR